MAYGGRANKFRSLQVSNAASLRLSKNNDATEETNELNILDSKSELKDEGPAATNEIGKFVYRKNGGNPRTLISNYLTKDYLEKRT